MSTMIDGEDEECVIKAARALGLIVLSSSNPYEEGAVALFSNRHGEQCDWYAVPERKKAAYRSDVKAVLDQLDAFVMPANAERVKVADLNWEAQETVDF